MTIYIVSLKLSPSFFVFQIRGVLNKLTPEKFDKLINEILSVDLSSTDILKGVIILVSE